MSEHSYSNFSKQERQILDVRYREITQVIHALEEEGRAIEARLEALDAMDQIFADTDQQLEKARTKQRQTNTEVMDTMRNQLQRAQPMQASGGVQAIR
ncbi:MAG: hypothetical protein HKN05_02030 [Rhizobiales bacterium]|nr:hypothetical protein [Hyphomicrobiales bacterium]